MQRKSYPYRPSAKRAAKPASATRLSSATAPPPVAPPPVVLPPIIDISGQCHIGKKGYTIPKSILPPGELKQLYKDLLLAPIPPPGAASFAGGASPPAFPVFRENANKIYVPRFYGVSRYGAPATSALHPGADIAISFPKSLRDYQIEIVDIFINHVRAAPPAAPPAAPTPNPTPAPFGGGILEVKTGRGKTVIALKIVAELRKKTLIIVHKEFLAEQWAERIAEFLPGATVGRIQGTIFDVEGKDIVIGMVQTLYKRPFEDSAFESFGMTIIDEVHRIGSEEFSKTLLRIVTPVMLGISATVERKDGLEQLLYMFIGPRIYQDTTPSDDAVCVRAIDYISTDPEFNTPILDFRGNPAFSPMVSRICGATHRTDFVVRVLADLVQESPASQIMVLAHQRAMLAYIHNEVVKQNIATVGFYIGGTKQAILKETEQKQIVLATFSMAAEALDIKTLSTLFMVTPMSNIVQSVGRILRAKHAQPIIVDIVDSQDIFKNQFRKRLAFYKGNNYRVRRIASDKYTGFADMRKWRAVHSPMQTASQMPEAIDPDDVIEESVAPVPVPGKLWIDTRKLGGDDPI